MSISERPAGSPESALSPDLLWMLKSGQAGQEMLAEALVAEFYTPLFHLALSVLDDAGEAAYATLEIFVTAVLNVYRFQNGGDLSYTEFRIWIYSLALHILHTVQIRLNTRRALKASLPFIGRPPEFGLSTPGTAQDATIWLAVDALDGRLRVPFLLHILHRWPEAEIARLLKVQEEDVRSWLDTARQDLLGSLQQAGFRIENRSSENLEDILQRSLDARWFVPDLSDMEREQVATEIASQAGRKAGRQRRSLSLKEIILLAAGALLALALLRGVDQLWIDPSPTQPVVTKLVFVRPTQLVVVTATPRPDPTRVIVDTPALPLSSGRLYAVQEGDTLQSIAGRAGMSAQYLRSLNRLPAGSPLRPGFPLVITAPQSLPTPVTPAPAPAPLNDKSTSQEILSRLQQSNSLWRSLWFDARLNFYGPPGYVGPAEAYHVQVWNAGLNQPQLILIGAAGQGPAMVVLFRDSNFFLAFPKGILATFTTGQEPPWLYWLLSDRLAPFASFGLHYGSFNPTSQSNYKVVGLEFVAGRQALVVDQMDGLGLQEARMWLDSRFGSVLRMQQYGGVGFRTLLWEYTLARVEFDAGFQPELFDPQLPWRGGFAADASGDPLRFENPDNLSSAAPAPGHEPLPALQPTQGFNSAHSPLTFQFPDSTQDLLSVDAPSTELVDLFAGPYALGKLEFNATWNVICDRSPDGRKVAFAKSLQDRDWMNFPLRWFDLDHVSQVNHLSLDAGVVEFSFAPDSRRLAIFGLRNSQGAVYIVDTVSRLVTRLLNLNYAQSLVWSPDGEYLGLIASREVGSESAEVMVVRVKDGEVVYQAPGDHPDDSPIDQWGVKFPVVMGGLEACTAAPGEGQ